MADCPKRYLRQGKAGRRSWQKLSESGCCVDFRSEEVEVVAVLIWSFSRERWLGLQKVVYCREELLGASSVFID